MSKQIVLYKETCIQSTYYTKHYVYARNIIIVNCNFDRVNCYIELLILLLFSLSTVRMFSTHWETLSENRHCR